MPLLGTADTVTTTFPVVAPVGTVTPMLVALQLEYVVAGVPPKVTVLLPRLVPKLVPLIVTVVPTAPLVCDKPVIIGPCNTWKFLLTGAAAAKLLFPAWFAVMLHVPTVTSVTDDPVTVHTASVVLV
jgi:hypothetical protein